MDVDLPDESHGPPGQLGSGDQVVHSDPADSAPPLTASGRPRRQYRMPNRFRDQMPDVSDPLAVPQPEPSRLPRVLLVVRDRVVTAANAFGLWRDYPRRPTVEPDSFLTLEDLANPEPPSLPIPLDDESAPTDHDNTQGETSHNPFTPFLSRTVQLLMGWANNGNIQKSEQEVDNLVHNVILDPEFRPEELHGFKANRENRRIDRSIAESKLRSQFTEATIDITVPSGDKNIKPSVFHVPGLLCRKITDVIVEAFNDPLAFHYHFSPFRILRKSPITNREERIYGEVYSSDAFLKEHEDVQRHSLPPPDNPGCKLEKVIAAIMFASDATHLTSFGNAKAWPIYFMLGNLSKYFRALPNSGAMHHLAYIPTVCPSSFIGD